MIVGAIFSAAHAAADETGATLAQYGPFVNAVMTFMAWVVGAAVVWGTARGKIEAADKKADTATAMATKVRDDLHQAELRIAELRTIIEERRK